MVLIALFVVQEHYEIRCLQTKVLLQNILNNGHGSFCKETSSLIIGLFYTFLQEIHNLYTFIETMMHLVKTDNASLGEMT